MQTSERKTLEVQVTGCGPYSCCLLGLTIERIRRLPGVRRAKVKAFPLSFFTKTLVVTYDPKQVTPEEICACCQRV